MTNFDRLKQQLNELYTLTMAQRAARLGLRAFWLGLAGVLFGWGVNILWGWLPNPISWFALGLVLALIPAGMVLLSLSTPSRWVRGLDQKMGFREEVNTAWEVAQKNQPGPINELLIEDVLARMPRVRKHTLKDGWVREVDLAATMIILVIACALLFSLLLPPQNLTTNEVPTEETPITQQQPEPEPQPQPGQDQEQGEGQTENPSGEGESQGQDSQSGEGTSENGDPQEGQQPGQDTPADQPAPDQGAVAEALRELGSDLSQQAGTYDLGQALENMDLPGAAEEMEELAGQLGDLSPESRDNLAQALEDAAEALDQAGQEGLSEDMSSASEALSGSSDEQASEALGDVAGELRNLDESMQASGGAGPGAAPQQGDGANTGNPEPLSRLNEEGGEMNLPLEPDDAPQSDLLGPASPDAVGEGTASGSLDRSNRSGQDAVQSPLLPNTLNWKWRDVISQYFQR